MKKDFICPECGMEREGARMEAIVCSPKCRIARFRRKKKESSKKTALELTINKKGDK